MGLFTNSSVSLPKRQINTFSSFTDSQREEESNPVNYETYYNAYKQSPEFLSVIESIVTDIVSDGGTITSDDKSKSEIKAMNKHLLKINWVKKIKQWLRHGLLTGDGYLEYHILTRQKFDSVVTECFKSVYGRQISKSVADTKLLKNIVRRWKEKASVEQFPFNIYPIKTTGMTKIVDREGRLKAFKQNVNASPIEFSVDEVINWMPIDMGEIYGMTPAQAVTDDIATLLFAKQYAGKFFENGGVPNIIFILEKARGMNDRNYEVAKTEIKNARKRKNWQKTMVLTGGGGGIKIEKLNDFKKDMEFIELINVCIRNIAMGFGVPPSKVPYKMETKGDLKEMNEGYWKDINEFQNQIESIVNEKIFRLYDMQWRFNRTYKIDEMREAQIIALLRDRELITEKEARTRMGYFTEKDKEDTPATRPASDVKHRDTGDKQDARGTGVDEGARINRSLKKSFTEAIEVKFDDFEKLVKMNTEGIENAKIFYKEYDDRFELYFNDLTGSYMCVVIKSELDDEKFFFEKYLSMSIRWE